MDGINHGNPVNNFALINSNIDKKIIVYKMRPKKKTRRKMGHRQELTRVMVKSIKIGKSAP